jgi:hypothetical protein
VKFFNILFAVTICQSALATINEKQYAELSWYKIKHEAVQIHVVEAFTQPIAIISKNLLNKDSINASQNFDVTLVISKDGIFIADENLTKIDIDEIGYKFESIGYFARMTDTFAATLIGFYGVKTVAELYDGTWWEEPVGAESFINYLLLGAGCCVTSQCLKFFCHTSKKQFTHNACQHMFKANKKAQSILIYAESVLDIPHMVKKTYANFRVLSWEELGRQFPGQHTAPEAITMVRETMNPPTMTGEDRQERQWEIERREKEKWKQLEKDEKEKINEQQRKREMKQIKKSNRKKNH